MTARVAMAGLLAWGIVAGPSAALDLDLPPTARLTAERVTELGRYDAPVGAFSRAGLPVTTMQGRVDRRAWRIETASMTPLQVLVPLRQQLEEMGYRVSFECDARTCGGFDFRFAIEVLPGPNMYVNLSQFHHLTAFLGPDDAIREAVSLLVSVADASAYLQVIHVEALAPDDTTPVSRPAPAVPAPVDPDGAQPDFQVDLRRNGRVILSDLVFASGTSDLSDGPYGSLTDVAEVLASNPGFRIALVGHTDTVGALDVNIALSRARAEAVRARLIEQYGIAPEQLDAEGMGYLAPVASNLTPEGREQNRRVEAVLLAVE